MEEKQYVAEISVKGHTFSIERKCFVDERRPHHTREIGIAIGKAIEKILDDNQLEVSQIQAPSIRWKSATPEYCEDAGGEVLEVKLCGIEFKTNEGGLYSLEEYTYPEVQILE